MTDPWFLLYGGTSADGAGPGRYIGRTLDITEARRHHAQCAADPYSTGYVLIVTDTGTRRMWPHEEWPVPKSGGGQ